MTDPRPPDPLRERLVAVLRPTLTRTVARMYVDQILDEVRSYGVDCAAQALEAQADLITGIVEAAQDCIEIMDKKPQSAPPEKEIP